MVFGFPLHRAEMPLSDISPEGTSCSVNLRLGRLGTVIQKAEAFPRRDDRFFLRLGTDHASGSGQTIREM